LKWHLGWINTRDFFRARSESLIPHCDGCKHEDTEVSHLDELTRASGPVLAVNQIPNGGKQDWSIGLLDPEADERGAQMKTLVVLDGSGSGDSAKA
jgi:hypothetical protein